jgi:peptidoglycan/LPS O-acetylase OafA/YrhL
VVAGATAPSRQRRDRGIPLTVAGREDPGALVPQTLARSERYDGFDVLRAGAILLGVFSHAARAYVPGIERYYPIADPASHALFAVLSSVVNGFRMQVFFAMSGFFAHLVLERRGAREFLRDRARRLVVPFCAAVPAIVALDLLVRGWSASRGLLSPLYRDGAAWSPAPLHLWFLQYLFLYCVIAFVLARRGVTGARAGRWLARAVQRPEVLVSLALPLALLLALHRGLNPARSFLPQPMTFLEYACFFGTGWLLWDARASLDALKRRGGGLAAAGLLLALAVAMSPFQWRFVGLVAYAFVPWLVTFGAIGLALRVRNAPRPRLRFLVEASYWVYLVHLPIVQLLQVGLGGVAWPAAPKFLTVVATTFGVTLASFAAFVRGGVLGEWLGAARRPASPAPATARWTNP